MLSVFNGYCPTSIRCTDPVRCNMRITERAHADPLTSGGQIKLNVADCSNMGMPYLASNGQKPDGAKDGRRTVSVENK